MVQSVYSDREPFICELVLKPSRPGWLRPPSHPFDAYARRLWDVNLPVANFEVPLQDRIAPIQPFQKVCALRHAHEMRADLRVEMRRYGNACRSGDRRRSQKSRHAMRSQAFFCSAK